MASQRLERVKEDLKKKTRIEGWITEKKESSWAPAGTWSNIDQDVAPLSRQTWNSWTLFGYWCSDIISIQSWQTGSTILALGLTCKSRDRGRSMEDLPDSVQGARLSSQSCLDLLSWGSQWHSTATLVAELMHHSQF